MARRSISSAGGGLYAPLLISEGSADQVVTVVVSTNADGCGSKDQSAKRQAAQAVKGSSKGCSSTDTSTSALESSELLTNWRKQTPLLFAWLLSSLVAAAFAPLLVPTQPMLLPALTAAALGLVASLVHVFSDHLAATKVLELSDQVSLVTACTLAAGCVDLLAMAMSVAWAWCLTSRAGASSEPIDMKPLLMFAFNCWQHGVVAVATMQSIGALQRGATSSSSAAQ